jgi:hypothetical protein
VDYIPSKTNIVESEEASMLCDKSRGYITRPLATLFMFMEFVRGRVC